jgi:hypothetical protein
VSFLSDKEVSETGGSHADVGVDFCRYWAISAVLALEEAGAQDYAIIFQYLQDVMVIESATAPTKAELYQVKKKDKGLWRRSELCRRSRTKSKLGNRRGTLKGRSILGKLYLAVEKVSPNLTVKGTFLSNAPCDVKTSTGECVPSHARTSIAELLGAERDQIESKIAKELGRNRPLEHLKALHIEQTRVPPGAMRECVQGMADDFLARNHPQASNISGRMVERMLQAFSNASGLRPGLESLDDIIRWKGYTRRQFTCLLAELFKIRPFLDDLDSALSGLKSEGMAPRLADQLRREAVRIKTVMMRQPETQQEYQWSAAIGAARSNQHCGSYSRWLQATSRAIQEEARKTGGRVLRDDDCAAVALLAMNHVDEEPATPHS